MDAQLQRAPELACGRLREGSGPGGINQYGVPPGGEVCAYCRRWKAPESTVTPLRETVWKLNTSFTTSTTMNVFSTSSPFSVSPDPLRISPFRSFADPPHVK